MVCVIYGFWALGRTTSLSRGPPGANPKRIDDSLLYHQHGEYCCGFNVDSANKYSHDVRSSRVIPVAIHWGKAWVSRIR